MACLGRKSSIGKHLINGIWDHPCAWNWKHFLGQAATTFHNLLPWHAENQSNQFPPKVATHVQHSRLYPIKVYCPHSLISLQILKVNLWLKMILIFFSLFRKKRLSETNGEHLRSNTDTRTYTNTHISCCDCCCNAVIAVNYTAVRPNNHNRWKWIPVLVLFCKR